MNINLIAIGRSRYLYDGIKLLSSKGYLFKAIVTDDAYQEYDIKASDFENLAYELNAIFFKTNNVENEDLINLIRSNEIQVAISANWKYLISKSFISNFEYGILNFHLGNLPDYKGNATVNWTIINGEDYIYGNIHKMEHELDSGDIIARKKIHINRDTYINDILKQAEKDAPNLYFEALVQLEKNPFYHVLKGSSEGLRCYPRLPEDSQIDWNKSVDEIYKLIKASSFPYSGAFTYLEGQKVIIWRANVITQSNHLAIPGHIVEVNKDNNTILVACKDGLIELEEIEVNGELISCKQLIKSIRTRFKYII